MSETRTFSEAPTGHPLPDEIRSRLAVALDVDDLVVATRLARELQPWFGTVKVGLELYSAAGPDAISAFVDLGLDVVCDLKFYDLPTTVGGAAKVLGALGARYVTFHAAGGVAMLRAGAEGLREGAASAGQDEPVPVSVLLLPHEAEPSEHMLRQRVMTGLESGCTGLFCAAPDLPVIREIAPAATLIAAGIRAPRAPVDDQARVATPREALDAGADLLVVGRAVTRASEPDQAAAELLADLAET